jgi:hypothetical protein|tara:strand:+ start:178 stop:633 length:456 start_codon:yes stop_codon:yes gene_type:complete
MSDDIDKIVDDLVGQFKTTKEVQKKKDELELTDETLKQFLYQYSGKLIKDSVEVVDDIKDFVTAAPDSRDLEALSKLIGASAAAIETLNKIQISDEKNKTQTNIKAMDIQAKKELTLQKAEEHVLTMNREELIDRLVSKAKTIEIEEDSSN